MFTDLFISFNSWSDVSRTQWNCFHLSLSLFRIIFSCAKDVSTPDFSQLNKLTSKERSHFVCLLAIRKMSFHDETYLRNSENHRCLVFVIILKETVPHLDRQYQKTFFNLVARFRTLDLSENCPQRVARGWKCRTDILLSIIQCSLGSETIEKRNLTLTLIVRVIRLSSVILSNEDLSNNDSINRHISNDESFIDSERRSVLKLLMRTNSFYLRETLSVASIFLRIIFVNFQHATRNALTNHRLT